MVDQLGRGYTIMGTAVPSTDPGTPDGPESWFASTPGTYTDMGGLTVANAELALLSYTPSDGWAKTTLTQGIVSTSASVNNQVGTPSVTSSYVDGVLTFTFENLKGNTGDPAGFGAVTASVDSNIGTPSVQVQTSGPDTAKAMSFQFHNLKGETGVTSVVATVDNTTGNPTCAVSLVGQELHLDFTGLKGVQGDTGVSADYPITIANNLTTNDPTSALSAAMGVQLESELSQLDLKVDDLDTSVYGGEHTVITDVTLCTIANLTNGGLIKDDGVTIQASGAGIYSGYIDIENISDMVVTGWASTNKIVFFYDADKVFISYALSGKKTEESVTIPPNAKYIRVNGLTASYLEGQSSSQYATNVTGKRTTSYREGGLDEDVATLKTDMATAQSDIAKLKGLRANKYLHISFDDAYRILKYLDTDSPASIFDEPRMALCKQLHDDYGAVFSFYLFNDEIDPDTEEVYWSIESTPNTYKSQFEACSDWIKFGYHTKNRNTNANGFTVAELTADYARTISVISNCIGLGSLDRVPRLGGYAGSLDRIQALRDTDAGIIGLLGPDDSRQGYYMSSSEASFLAHHDRWTDGTNQLSIVKTDLRLESYPSITSVISGWESASGVNYVRELVLFTHEGVVFVSGNNIPDNLDTICAWAVANGYDFDYPQNRIW